MGHLESTTWRFFGGGELPKPGGKKRHFFDWKIEFGMGVFFWENGKVIFFLQ